MPVLSFFQTWSWVGCLAAERYADPVLLRAEEDGQLSGLALFNRHRGCLHLAASGVSALDSPFIEHNAPLAMRREVSAALLRAAWGVRGARSLSLAGTDPESLAAAGGVAWREQCRVAPRVTLDPIRRAGTDYLGSRSANTRYQLRRALRAYAARGEVVLAKAEQPAEALGWLTAMIALHEARWQAEGRPGAFASDYLRRFHHALVLRAIEAGALDMVRVTAGEEIVGYLYNFRLRGHVHAYQSGFSTATGHEKPGMACHALAIQHALDTGEEVYDFLGGEDRYKRSLANDQVALLWADLVPALSVRGVAARLRAVLGGGKAGHHGTSSNR